MYSNEPSVIRYCYKIDGLEYKYLILKSMTYIKLKDMSEELIKNELLLRMSTFYPSNDTYVWLLNDVLDQRVVKNVYKSVTVDLLCRF